MESLVEPGSDSPHTRRGRGRYVLSLRVAPKIRPGRYVLSVISDGERFRFPIRVTS